MLHTAAYLRTLRKEEDKSSFQARRMKITFCNIKFVLFIDVITCLSLDDDGHHLITGSRDSTCHLWGITHQGGVAQEVIRTPLQTLYGHDKPITCVVMSWELDMAVSGSQVSFNV